jgi:hypothetical protein
MTGLSISKAWDETRAIVAHDGRLFASVALALVALPTAITELINPSGMRDASPMWLDAVVLVASLAVLVGQLALIRLALAPSVAVGEAVAHALRRMPIYVLAAILVVIGLLILAIPFGAVLIAMGVPLDSPQVPATPGVILALILYAAVVVFVAVRMLMSAPVASAERAGPFAILKRSWLLTAGHWWRLFGFMMMFFLVAIVTLLALGAAAGAIGALAFGPIEPLSLSALLVALVQAFANAAITTLFTVMLARIYVQVSGRSGAQASVPSSGT